VPSGGPGEPDPAAAGRTRGGRAEDRRPGADGGLDRGLALLVAGSLFMEILDGTVIAPAAPHIGADLGVSAVDVNVAISAYVLTLAVLIPLSGWLSDRFGSRRIFLTAIAVFTLASAGCAAAPTLPVLTALRVLQAAGGALMVPVGRLVVLRTTGKADLLRAIAYLTWPALVAPVVAPALGGLLSTYASWRWIFLLNLPLGLAGLLLARRLVPDVRDATARLDRRGVVLTAVGVAALVVGLESIGSGGPDARLAVPGLLLGMAVIAAAAVHLLRAPVPLLDLRILAVATYRVSAVGGTLFRAVITAVPFLLPLLFQLGFGWTAAQAGLAVVALFVGNLAIKPATTPLMRRFGIRPVLAVAVLASAASLVGMAGLAPGTPLPSVLAVLFVSGIARSVAFSAYNSVAFADVPHRRMTSANTLLSALQELGAGLGIAVGALLVRLADPLTAPLGIGDGAAAPYRFALLVLAAALLVAVAEAVRLPANAGAEVTRRRRT
jgi:EmrB/QacA subfamily drug resistance transporter